MYRPFDLWQRVRFLARRLRQHRLRRAEQRRRHLRHRPRLALESLEERAMLTADTVWISDYYDVDESSGASYVQIERDNSIGDLAVNVSVSGSATSGVDYQAFSTTVVIPDGDWYAPPIEIIPIDDAVYEWDETVVVTLQPAAAYDIAWPNEAAITITNEEDMPYVEASGQDVAEGDSGPAFATWTFSVVGATERPVSFDFATSEGSATAGDDFTAATAHIVIQPGEFANYQIEILGDTEDEEDEDYSVDVFNVENAWFDLSSFAVIIDDDSGAGEEGGSPEVTISDAADNEGDSGTTDLSFWVDVFGTATEDIVVTYQTLSGTADPGSDYIYTNSYITIPSGQNSGTIDIPIHGDTGVEEDEYFTLQVISVTGADYFGSDPTGTIWNDDSGGGGGGGEIDVVWFDPNANDLYDANEYSGSAGITFKRDHTSSARTVYFTVSGTATEGVDYQDIPREIVIPDGEQFAWIEIIPIDDAVYEWDETVILTLLDGSDYDLGSPSTATSTIHNEEDRPYLEVVGGSVLEGDSGTAPVAFTFTLSGPTERNTVIEFATADGSAVAGQDYHPFSGTIDIPPGYGGQLIIAVIGDVLEEQDEHFGLELFSVTNADVGDLGFATILEDGDVIPDLFVTGGSVNEGGTLAFEVQLSEPGSDQVIFQYTIIDETTEPEDYDPPAGYDAENFTGTGSISVGATSFTISLPTLLDSTDEYNETLRVEITSASGANVADPSATGTILDIDPEPVLTVHDILVEEGEDAVFYLTLSGGSSEKELAVDVYTVNGSAAAPQDFEALADMYEPQRITLNLAEPSTAIVVATVDDQETELDEDFYLHLIDVYGSLKFEVKHGDGSSTISDYTADAKATIKGEYPVSVFATNVYARETAPGQPADVAEIMFSRGGHTEGDATILYEIVTGELDGGEADPSDYGSLSGSITIPDGATSATLVIAPTDDSEIEWDEHILVKISDVGDTEVYFADWRDSAVVTILDNDGYGGLLSRNVDAESTGLAKDAISNGVVSVDVYGGEVELDMEFFPGRFSPTYSSDDNMTTLLPLATELPAGDKPDSLAFRASFADGASSSQYGFYPYYYGDYYLDPFYYYDPWYYPATHDTENLDWPSGPLHFVGRSSTFLRDLPSGHYDYRLVVAGDVAGERFHRTITGGSEIVNRTSPGAGTTEFGRGWWIEELDRLVPGDGTQFTLVQRGLAAEQGMALIRGDNSSAWYVAAPDLAGGEQKSAGEAVVSEDPFTEESHWESDGTFWVTKDNYYWWSGGAVNAQWAYDGLDPNRQYQLFTTWTAGLDRASGAHYEIEAQRIGYPGSEDPAVVYVDQRYTPGEIEHGGKKWRSLGFFSPRSDGTIQVTLSGAGGWGWAGGHLVAGDLLLVDDWTYQTPDGSVSELLAESGGGFTLNTKHGGEYDFDGLGLLEQFTDRNQNRTQYEYTDADADGLVDELHSITVQGGLTTYYHYADGTLYEITDPLDMYRVTGYLVDAAGYLREITEPAAFPGADPPVTEFAYNGPNRKLTALKDAEGFVTGIAYDWYAQRASGVVNPDAWSPAWDDVDDWSGYWGWYWGYGWGSGSWQLVPQLVSGLHNSLGQSGADNFHTPPAGQIGALDPGDPFVTEPRATYTDPRGHTWTYQTDRFGLVTAEAKPATAGTGAVEHVWLTTRERNGLPTSHTQPAGGGGDLSLPAQTTVYAYDGKLNLNNVLYPDGFTDTWVYDPQYAVAVSHNDRAGQDTGYQLDPFGNIDVVTEANLFGPSRQTKFQYTPAPNSISDLPGGLITDVTAAYQSADAVTTHTDYYTAGLALGLPHKVYRAQGTAVESFVEFVYDDRRRLDYEYDELRRVTDYEHDDLDQLIAVARPDPGTGHHSAPITRYFYDAVGNLRFELDPRQAITYDFAVSPDLFDEETTFADVTEYRYDGMRRLTHTILAAPGGHEQTANVRTATQFVYDAAGNVAKEVLHLDGNPDSIGSGDRVTELVYDERNQLTRKKLPQPLYPDVDPLRPLDALVRPEYVYAYDVHGNVKEFTDPRGNVAGKYRYDALGRLVREEGATDPTHGHAPVTVYDLDPLGRVVAQHLPGDYLPVENFIYDRFGRLVEEHSPLNAGGTRLVARHTYDLRDNLLSTEYFELTPGSPDIYVSTGVFEQYVYDRQDRLIAIDGADPTSQVPGLVTLFAYDAAGNLLRELVHAGQLTAGTDVLADGSGFYTTAAQVDSLYAQLTGAGQKLQFTTYARDNLGRAVTVQEGSYSNVVTTSYTYDNRGNAWETAVSFTETLPDGTQSPVWLVSNATYDALNRPWAVLGPQDEFANRPETLTAYNPDGSVKQQTVNNTELFGGPSWRTTSYEYDTLGRPYRTTSPDPDGDPFAGASALSTVTYFDAGGNLIATIEPGSRVASHQYDDLNRLLVSYGPVFTGDVPSITDGEVSYVDTYSDLRERTEYRYYIDGTLFTESKMVVSPGLTPAQDQPRADLSAKEIIRDPLGLPAGVGEKTTDGTRFSFTLHDLFGRPVKLTNSAGGETYLGYDLLGNRTSETIDDSVWGQRTTHWRYDSFGHLGQRIDRQGQTIQYVTDSYGNVLTEQWFTTEGTPVTSIPWFITTEFAEVERYEYTHTPDGRLRTAADPGVSSTAFTYDALRRPDAAVVAHPAFAGDPFVLDYAFNLLGEQQRRTITRGSDVFSDAAFSYDQLGRLAYAKDHAPEFSNEPSAQLSYDSSQRRVNRYVGNVEVGESTYTYLDDVFSRLGQVEHTTDAGATVLAMEALDYDVKGRPWRVHRNGQQNPELLIGSFDAEDQFLQPSDDADQDSFLDPYYRISDNGSAHYEYDANGNIERRWSHEEKLGLELRHDASQGFEWEDDWHWWGELATNLTLQSGWYRLRLDDLTLETVNVGVPTDDARLILTWLNEDETIEGDSGWVPIEFEALPGLNAAGRHVFRGKPTAFYFQHLPAGNYRFQLGLFQPEGTQPESPFYGRVAIDRLVALDKLEWDQRQRVTEVQRFQNPSGTNIALAPVDGLPTNLAPQYTVLYQYDALDNVLTRRKVDNDSADGIDPDVVTHFIRDGGRTALELNDAGQVTSAAVHSPNDGRLLFVVATKYDGAEATEHVLWPLADYRGWVAHVYEAGVGLDQLDYRKNGVPVLEETNDWWADQLSGLRDGMEYDLYSQLYFDAGQAFDVFSARYATEHFAGALASGGGSPYSFRGHPGTGENGSDSHNHAGSSDFSLWNAFWEQPGARRTLGGLQFIGGAIQFYGGVMMAPTVIGLPVAVFLMARGADDMLAGGTTYVTGEYTETLTYRATYAATGSQSAATVVDVGTGLISPAIATGVIIKGARASRLTRLAAVARQVDRFDDATRVARLGQATRVAGATGTARITPRMMRAKAIVEDPRLHRYWEDAMRELSAGRGRSGRALREYLNVIEGGDVPTARQARMAYNSVRANFIRRVDGAVSAGERFPGFSFERIHHWNWHIGDHSLHALDPRQLFPVTQHLHELIHIRTTIGPVRKPMDVFLRPIHPIHRLDLDYSYPLAPR